MHGLVAAEHQAALQEPGKTPKLLGFVAPVHGQVGTVPVADGAQPLAVDALAVHLLGGELAAGFSKLSRIEPVAQLAEAAFDLVLDGQTVAVPAGYVGGVVPGERAGLDDDVLEHLVERVPQVNVAVGIGRSVMQHEQRPALGRSANLPVDILLLPALEHFGLALGEIAAHGEARARQVEGVLVVCHGASRLLSGLIVRHGAHAANAARAFSTSLYICTFIAARSEYFRSSRRRRMKCTVMYRP